MNSTVALSTPKLDNLDQAPEGPALTEYDRRHIKLYMRLLDAESDGASWQEAVEILFGISPVTEPERARRVHDSHLARAHWMTEHGYRQLRRGLPH
ncbi:DNA -binding domain-containing protein [Agrobacterium radiobacter]|uniref:DNA -binding domain-containing protein n=1 Tax=Agrobacterium radiobacter TaxID=362 RepID=UPI003F85B3EC